jgi:hypothetical protein
MITETQPHLVVLHLADALLALLRPFMEGLDITATLQSAWADREVYEHGQFAGYAKVEQCQQRLTMHGEVYEMLCGGKRAGLRRPLAAERV